MYRRGQRRPAGSAGLAAACLAAACCTAGALAVTRFRRWMGVAVVACRAAYIWRICRTVAHQLRACRCRLPLPRGCRGSAAPAWPYRDVAAAAAKSGTRRYADAVAASRNPRRLRPLDTVAGFTERRLLPTRVSVCRACLAHAACPLSALCRERLQKPSVPFFSCRLYGIYWLWATACARGRRDVERARIWRHTAFGIFTGLTCINAFFISRIRGRYLRMFACLSFCGCYA